MVLVGVFQFGCSTICDEAAAKVKECPGVRSDLEAESCTDSDKVTAQCLVDLPLDTVCTSLEEINQGKISTSDPLTQCVITGGLSTSTLPGSMSMEPE